MANTYTQCYFHLVFAVKYRRALISKKWNEQLEKYITGIVQSEGHKLLAIGTMPDHIHILIGYDVNKLIPKIVEAIKTSSNKWIKDNQLSPYKFSWQKGYGAFTHSRSTLDNVVKYILNQEEHHKKRTFKQEYMGLLKKYEIEYNDNYMFEFFDNTESFID